MTFGQSVRTTFLAPQLCRPATPSQPTLVKREIKLERSTSHRSKFVECVGNIDADAVGEK